MSKQGNPIEPMESFQQLASFMRASRLALGVENNHDNDPQPRVVMTNQSEELFTKLTPKRSKRKRKTNNHRKAAPVSVSVSAKWTPIKLSSIYRMYDK